jgi:hypothetical protein
MSTASTHSPLVSSLRSTSCPRANHRRPFLGLLALATIILAARAPAQTSPKAPATFRTLSLGTTVSGVFYDRQSKPVPVMAGSSGFSAPYTAPSDGHVRLYRVTPAASPDVPAERVTLSETPMFGGPFLIFMAADPATPSMPHVMVVDDSWDAHPVRTMKVYNFSRRVTLVKVGDTSGEIAPGKSHLFPYPDGTQLWFQAATREESGWKLRISGPQLIMPEARSTAVLVDQLPSDEFRPQTDELLIRNFIDPQPPKPTA